MPDGGSAIGSIIQGVGAAAQAGVAIASAVKGPPKVPKSVSNQLNTAPPTLDDAATQADAATLDRQRRLVGLGVSSDSTSGAGGVPSTDEHYANVILGGH